MSDRSERQLQWRHPAQHAVARQQRTVAGVGELQRQLQRGRGHQRPPRLAERLLGLVAPNQCLRERLLATAVLVIREPLAVRLTFKRHLNEPAVVMLFWLVNAGYAFFPDHACLGLRVRALEG